MLRRTRGRRQWAWQGTRAAGPGSEVNFAVGISVAPTECRAAENGWEAWTPVLSHLRPWLLLTSPQVSVLSRVSRRRLQLPAPRLTRALGPRVAARP